MQVKNPEVRKRIVEAARRVFFEKGYKSARLNLIAKEGYTTISNVYTYFEGKQDLFETVIGDVPVLIDTYIAQYYCEAIRKFSLKNKFDIYHIFPEKLIFSKEESMVLRILLEGAEGTSYACYKDSLYELLKDCIRIELGENVEPAIVNLLSYSFVEKVLAVQPKEDNKRKDSLGLKMSDIYKFNVNKQDKKVELQILCWSYVTREGIDAFWLEYDSVMDGINTIEYEYTVDCREMPVIFEEKYLKEITRKYCETQFKAVKYIFTKKQVALAIVFKRLIGEIGHDSAKVIFQN